MNINEMEQYAYDNGINVIDYYISDDLHGLVYKDTVAIKPGLTTSERLCVLAEEISHYELRQGNILDTSLEHNRHQEALARQRAYRMLLGKDFIIEKIKGGISTIYELSEACDLPVKFCKDACVYYGLL